MYFNRNLLWPQAYGVQAASRTYFRKDVSELNLASCISSWSYKIHRYEVLRTEKLDGNRLDNMVRAGFITPEAAEEAKNQPIEMRSAQGGLSGQHRTY